MAALAASSRSTRSRVTLAAAQATGLPPNVEPWPPGSQSMISARATMPASGRPLARPLPMHMMSGSAITDPSARWQAHIVPVRPIPDCTSSTTNMMPWRSQSARRSASQSSGGTM